MKNRRNMTKQYLFQFYALCLIAGIATGYYFGLIAGIAAFAGTAIAQTQYEENRRRP